MAGGLGIGMLGLAVNRFLFAADVALHCERATSSCRYTSQARVTSSEERFAAADLLDGEYRARTKGGSTVYLVVRREGGAVRMDGGQYGTDEGREVAERVDAFVQGRSAALDVRYDGVGPAFWTGAVSLLFGTASLALAVGERRSMRRWRRRTAGAALVQAVPAAGEPPSPGEVGSLEGGMVLGPIVDAVRVILPSDILAAGFFAVDRATRRRAGWPANVLVARTSHRVVVVGVAYTYARGRPAHEQYRPLGVLADWEVATVDVDVDQTDLSTRALLLRPASGEVIVLSDGARYGQASYNDALYAALAPGAA